MLKLMDFDRDKEISWREFHTFISYKVLESQDVLEGELVLPSGLTLPLGAMIVALRRKQVMREILNVSVGECGAAPLRHDRGLEE